MDPATDGGHVAKVRHVLAGADPPYTPDDVREFGRQFLTHCSYARGERDRPNPGELQKYIGRIRAGPVAVAAPARPNNDVLFG